MQPTRRRLAFTLVVLLGINALNFFDRQVLGVVGQSVKDEWGLSDTMLGWLGTAFTLLYAVIGVPLGRWADTGPRVKILAAGVTLWGALTALSGMARTAAMMFVLRLGVGVGEASCAPAATSLLGDLFPRERRARAMGLFMLGLPLGLSLSFFVGGYVAHHYGWRNAFYVAGVPGLLLGLLALAIPEPPRGTAELRTVGAARRPGSPVLLVLGTPTMAWIAVSGALHNFNMYAIGSFLGPFLQRYHGLNVHDAGTVGGITYGVGALGILLGGWAGDRMVGRRIGGRLEAAAVALAISVPCVFLALRCPPAGTGLPWAFTAWMLLGLLFMYVYYSTVYATIQDLFEPALRGTAMAVYFCAMYLFGASLGPVGTGWLSDHFARQAAAAAGSSELTAAAKAAGLHDAMYVIPVLGCLLVVVLAAASRTVHADYRRLQTWMETDTPKDAG
jgi:MFS family permease